MDKLHVIMPSDVFPPVSGGAGWSAHALARALQARGHRVTAIVPRRGPPGIIRNEVDGVPVVRLGYAAPRVPFVQNYYRFELLWPSIRNVVIAEASRHPDLPVVIHAQHTQSAGGAALARVELNAPVLVTVRDAWPWHYFATGLLADRLPNQRWNAWTIWLDLVGRLGPLRGVVAAPAVVYVERHMRQRAALLARCDGVIAVSRYIDRKLEPIVAASKRHVIPNLVDIAATRRTANEPSLLRPDEPFVLFVGKLERNKGAQLLPEAMSQMCDRSGSAPLLLIAGSGELEHDLGRELERREVRYQILEGWTSHDDILRLMLRAELLLYPSAWGEPLSRVLLEASAVGACIVAMNTGGTADAIVDGVSGVLVRDETELGCVAAELMANPTRRQELRAGALQTAEQRFDADTVAGQVEALYRRLLEERRDAGLRGLR